VWIEHDQAYGPRKVWKQLRREGIRVARCPVERLMPEMGLRGVSRGRAWVVTTRADERAGPPADLVDRQFHRLTFAAVQRHLQAAIQGGQNGTPVISPGVSAVETSHKQCWSIPQTRWLQRRGYLAGGSSAISVATATRIIL
jgi:transposase InsO family protein